jgi:hypothetical protein
MSNTEIIEKPAAAGLPAPTVTTELLPVVSASTPPAPAPAPTQGTPAATIMQMIQLAVERGNLEVVSKLMDLQERAEATQARKEFDAAFAAVKAKVGIVRKTGVGHQGKAYADMADLARALDPVIAEHGLSYRFRSQRVGNELVMTCIVCHRAGHFEENSLPAPLDTSGSKNPTQAIGSTSTYLQRYTLVQAFGLAASVNGDAINDDDGEGASIGKDGHPRGSLYQPGDYAGGIPEKITKQNGERINKSRQLYADLRREIEALIEQGISPVDFDQWGKENAHRTEALAGEWFDEINRYWLEAVKRVHDNSIAASISQRAIDARNQVAGRPSRRNAEPTDHD